MSKSVWNIYVDYGEGYGWVPVRWAPAFETLAEAQEWISGDHDWESPVRAFQDEVEDDEDEDDSDNEPDGSWMDADALASAGHGTDEDYGYYGD